MTETVSASGDVEHDLQAIEDAIVLLGRAARMDAEQRGTSAVDHANAETFRATHTQIAALIADPINEVCYFGMEAIRRHLLQNEPPEVVEAIYRRALARIAEVTGLDLLDRPRIH